MIIYNLGMANNMIGKLKNLSTNPDKSQNITITVTSDCRDLYDELKDSEVNIEIKKTSKRRSLEANAYLWYLCGEIAKATSKFSTNGKDDIYREAIKAKGEWAEVIVPEKGLDYFINNWSERGTGWFAEVIDDEIDDFDSIMGDSPDRKKKVHVYFGSSVYSSLSMSHVIDYVVNIASDLGIPTLTENEYEKMMAAWGRKKGEHE